MATREKLFKMRSGYYLLYYHRQKPYTMFLLYLRFLIPLAGLFYLIRKNPFYKTYPIMLPIMIIALIATMMRTVKYSRSTNHMVH